jgi:hypothetical protein
MALPFKWAEPQEIGEYFSVDKIEASADNYALWRRAGCGFEM